LRERREDIALLAQHFLAHAPGASTAGKRFSPEALRALETRDWPGNVRELQACVLRAAALSTGRVIVPGDLARPSEPPPTGPTSAAPWDALCQAALREGVLSLDALNARYARAALAHFDGNKTRAAEALGVDRKTLRRLLGPDGGA
jgi:DNA-binding NtrC family response regulator